MRCLWASTAEDGFAPAADWLAWATLWSAALVTLSAYASLDRSIEAAVVDRDGLEDDRVTNCGKMRCVYVLQD